VPVEPDHEPLTDLANDVFHRVLLWLLYGPL
jgi:hypothetical protein